MTLAEYEAIYPPRELPPGAEVTRVAPSPTGRPHIGTALQALIDRAIAQRTGGIFILRIEDTDQKRLDPLALKEILEALEWLGLRPDEGPGIGGAYGPYVQSERLPLYRAAAEWLVEHGFAYYCFCSAERLEALRKEQVAAGQTPMYDRHCQSLAPSQARQRKEAGEPCVVRLRVPPGRVISFTDPLRGEISFQSDLIDDQVLLKSDGFPTYHLAVVVDDHFMRVTTVVRGEEWISSTPKHLLLYEYFGWQAPQLVHTPLLRDSSRRKLSKRAGDTSIEWFRSQGYLPEGLRNFLSRIIWAHPQEKDIYSFSEFASLFRIEDMSRAGPVVDRDLLEHINSQYLRELSPEEFYQELLGYVERLAARGEPVAIEVVGKEEQAVTVLSAEELRRWQAALARDPAYSKRVLQVERERFRKLADVLLQYGFFFAELFQVPEPALLAKHLGSGELAARLLQEYGRRYDHGATQEEWEAMVRGLAEEAGVKARALFMTIRVALTGAERTPPLYEIQQVLGEQEVRRRVASAIEALLAETLPEENKA